MLQITCNKSASQLKNCFSVNLSSEQTAMLTISYDDSDNMYIDLSDCMGNGGTAINHSSVCTCLTNGQLMPDPIKHILLVNLVLVDKTSSYYLIRNNNEWGGLQYEYDYKHRLNQSIKHYLNNKLQASFTDYHNMNYYLGSEVLFELKCMSEHSILDTAHYTHYLQLYILIHFKGAIRSQILREQSCDSLWMSNISDTQNTLSINHTLYNSIAKVQFMKTEKIEQNTLIAISSIN